MLLVVNSVCELLVSYFSAINPTLSQLPLLLFVFFGGGNTAVLMHMCYLPSITLGYVINYLVLFLVSKIKKKRYKLMFILGMLKRFYCFE